MIRNMPKLAIALALSASAGAASAAEIILFENPGFGGRQVEISDFTPSVGGIGFNDRASSIVVTSGRWEVCTDNDFKGFCAILGRGEYRALDPRLNERISSVREVGTTGRYEDPNRARSRASVQLFSAPGFKGRSVQFDQDSPNFADNGFNDRAASLVVNEGTWLLCTDAGFRGQCRTYAPGRYADLGYGMTRSLSSAQIVRAHTDGQARHRGGYTEVPVAAAPVAPSAVTLFSEADFTGSSLQISSNIVDLRPTGFNDLTESMVIQGGTWEVCADPYFRGRCRVMGPGQYPRFGAQLSGNISSIRTAQSAPPPPAPFPQQGQAQGQVAPPVIARSDVELYTVPNFGGRRFTGNNNMLNFDANDFNDRFGSLVINEGTWEMCVDINFRGGCTLFGPGRYPQIGGLTNQISSMRRVY